MFTLCLWQSGSKWGVRYLTCTSLGQLLYYSSNVTTSPNYTLSLAGMAVRDDGVKASRNNATQYYVFSIYRGTSKTKDEDIVPLLRFSVPTKEEHKVWMAAIVEACAVHQTEPASATASKATPTLHKGVLAPIYFGDANATYSKKNTAADGSKTKSTNVAAFQPSRPMHRTAKVSYLSDGSGHTNYVRRATKHTSMSATHLRGSRGWEAWR